MIIKKRTDRWAGQLRSVRCNHHLLAHHQLFVHRWVGGCHVARVDLRACRDVVYSRCRGGGTRSCYRRRDLRRLLPAAGLRVRVVVVSRPGARVDFLLDWRRGIRGLLQLPRLLRLAGLRIVLNTEFNTTEAIIFDAKFIIFTTQFIIFLPALPRR